MPNVRAQLLFHRKEHDTDGRITELKIWAVPVTEHTPHGVKYSLVYVVNGSRVIGYDNERGKGDHRHILGVEYSYEFVTIAKLVIDFEADVESFRKGEL